MPEKIAVYRAGEENHAFSEQTARIAEGVMFYIEGAIGMADKAIAAGEMHADVARELREIHALVRQRALGMSRQGRLV